jgi:hypothetical protein
MCIRCKRHCRKTAVKNTRTTRVSNRRDTTMRIGLKQITPVLAAGAVAAGIAAAPTAAADNSEFCTNLNTGSTKCQKQGNVEVNDSLSHANTMAPWSTDGLFTGGPYLGTLGGGNR